MIVILKESQLMIVRMNRIMHSQNRQSRPTLTTRIHKGTKHLTNSHENVLIWARISSKSSSARSICSDGVRDALVLGIEDVGVGALVSIEGVTSVSEMVGSDGSVGDGVRPYPGKSRGETNGRLGSD